MFREIVPIVVTCLALGGCTTPPLEGSDSAPDGLDAGSTGLDGGGSIDGAAAIDGATTADSGSEGSDAGPPDPSGPRVLMFSTDVGQITEGETVTFTLVATDPDGTDDLVGGSLVDPGSAAVYGGLATPSGGTFEVTLSWADIHRVRPVEFTAPIARAFEARLFDVAGHEVRQVISVELTCGAGGACDGVCTDLTTTTDCAACGTACRADQLCAAAGCGCPDGQSDCGSSCEDLSTTSNCLVCGTVCAVGAACTAGGCACPDGQGACDGECTDLSTTTDCAACGVTCRADQVCGPTGCTCPDGETLCGSTCVSLGSDAHCTDCDDACASATQCSAGACVPVADTIRLGPSDTLEVLHDGEWRGVCDNGFGSADARVACRQMGGSLVSFQTEQLGWTGEFWLSDLACNGSEEALADCSHPGWGNDGDCWANESIGIDCEVVPEGTLRANSRGLLEIRHELRWQGICDDRFDMAAATVACRQMGTTLVSFETGQTGTSSSFAIDEIMCTGTESNLEDCTHAGWGVEDCGASEWVRVTCS